MVQDWCNYQQQQKQPVSCSSANFAVLSSITDQRTRQNVWVSKRVRSCSRCLLQWSVSMWICWNASALAWPNSVYFVNLCSSPLLTCLILAFILDLCILHGLNADSIVDSGWVHANRRALIAICLLTLFSTLHLFCLVWFWHVPFAFSHLQNSTEQGECNFTLHSVSSMSANVHFVL